MRYHNSHELLPRVYLLPLAADTPPTSYMLYVRLPQPACVHTTSVLTAFVLAACEIRIDSAADSLTP